MRRQIRAEKEEVERREGMEGGEDGDEGDGASQRGRSSRASTPGAATPSQSNRAQEMEVDLGRLAPDGHLARREKSPLRSVQTMGEEKAETPAVTNEDTSMAEDGEVEPDGDVVAVPLEGLVAEDEKESGEEDDGAVEADSKDHMDTS